MTHRLYLTAVRFENGDASDSDIPVERVFVNASDVPEIWVETETASPPGPGKAVTFALRRDLSLGFMRVIGTVERRVAK
jgi:hypothetical protein